MGQSSSQCLYSINLLVTQLECCNVIWCTATAVYFLSDKSSWYSIDPLRIKFASHVIINKVLAGPKLCIRLRNLVITCFSIDEPWIVARGKKKTIQEQEVLIQCLF